MSATKFIFLAIGTAFFTSLSAYAGTYEVPVVEGDHLLVKGLSAQVQFIAQPGAKTLKVSGMDDNAQAGHYTLTKRGAQIEVRMTDYDDKQTWKKALASANSQTRKIEIVGPAIPVEVHLRNGSISLNRWNHDAKLSLIQGRVSSQNGAGTLMISLQKGDIIVSDHAGRVQTDAYNGVDTLKNIQGDIESQLFSGSLIIEKAKGSLSLNTSQASSKVLQSSGSLQIENGKGIVNVQGFQGRIDGQTGEGSMTISFLPESELDLKSKSGRVNVQAPANSGATLNLRTIDGDIFVPKEVSVNRGTSEKSVRGRLRGETQKGSIAVHSQEGSILVK